MRSVGMQERGKILMLRQAFYDIQKRHPQTPHLYLVYSHVVFQASFYPESMGWFDTTTTEMCEVLNLSYNKVRGALSVLKKTGMIGVQIRRVGPEIKGVRVTVLDYVSLHRTLDNITDPLTDLRASLTVSGSSSTEES
jgi:hypothetical protein